MPNAAENRPSYVTKGDVFRDLGFTPEKALALKFKAKILIAILDEVKRASREAEIPCSPREAWPHLRDVAERGDVGARALLISGRPLREPVAWGGPFVMNTREEVLQAFDDYRQGRF